MRKALKLAIPVASCAVLAGLFVAYVSNTYMTVPFVGMDTSRRYYVYKWGSKPVEVGGAVVVTRDHKHYFYVERGWQVQDINPPESRFFGSLIYERVGTDGSDANAGAPAVVVGGVLRFDIGDIDRPDYVEYKLHGK